MELPLWVTFVLAGGTLLGVLCGAILSPVISGRLARSLERQRHDWEVSRTADDERRYAEEARRKQIELLFDRRLPAYLLVLALIDERDDVLQRAENMSREERSSDPSVNTWFDWRARWQPAAAEAGLLDANVDGLIKKWSAASIMRDVRMPDDPMAANADDLFEAMKAAAGPSNDAYVELVIAMRISLGINA